MPLSTEGCRVELPVWLPSVFWKGPGSIFASSGVSVTNSLMAFLKADLSIAQSVGQIGSEADVLDRAFDSLEEETDGSRKSPGGRKV